jgi:hypothetical protein
VPISGFYLPTQRGGTAVKLPSFASGANSNPSQSLLSGVALNSAAATPYKALPITPSNPLSDVASTGGYGPTVGANPQTVASTTKTTAAAPSLPGDSSAADQQYMYNLMNNDPTLAGELNQLAGQNQAAWSSFLSQAQQAEIAYGGGYDPTAAAAVGYNPSAFSASTFTNTIPGSSQTYGQPTQTLADALSDPNVLSAIAPGSGGYNVSALGQIANQYAIANRTAEANLRARGMYNSSSLGQDLNANLQQNQLAQNTALNNFLGALQSGYGSYLTGFGNIQSSAQGDIQTELQNIIAGIGAGVYTLPSSAPKTTTAAPSGGGGGDGGDGGGDPFAPNPPPGDADVYGGYIPPVAAYTPAPKSATAPYTVASTTSPTKSSPANLTGLSANKKQGVFAVH